MHASSHFHHLFTIKMPSGLVYFYETWIRGRTLALITIMPYCYSIDHNGKCTHEVQFVFNKGFNDTSCYLERLSCNEILQTHFKRCMENRPLLEHLLEMEMLTISNKNK